MGFLGKRPVKRLPMRDYAAARDRLLRMLEQCSPAIADRSVPERALHAACEFWSAVESGTLQQLLQESPERQLRYLSIVYAAIGATQVAKSMDETLAALAAGSGSGWRRHCILTLHASLNEWTDPLLDLMGRSAESIH